MIQEPNSAEIKMLLLAPYRPYEYHAQALLSYMDQNGFSQIKINGGGKVEMSPQDEFLFYEKSYAFKYANHAEIQALCNQVWPGRAIRITSPNSETVMSRVWTKSQVKHEADNP
jgi:hypothetical protein